MIVEDINAAPEPEEAGSATSSEFVVGGDIIVMSDGAIGVMK